VTATAITLGPLHSSHRTQIEEIVRAAGVFSEEEVGVAVELFDEGSDYEFIGAFSAERLIGYACFGATPSTDRTYDLYWIAVHPALQRSGAGSMLMTEIERRLEERRARMVVVETSSREDYGPTRRFYHKHGYTEAARLRDFYSPGDDRVVLGKRFTGSSDPGGSAAARPLSA
jgi:ribosomal protein S18 acetylase RimI-like enzyme